MPRKSAGRVILVGAGPGDPGLLTLRGRDALAEADVVVYDGLIDPKVLAFAPPRARRIPAESLGPHGEARQRAINRTLVEEARRGHTVVRLKGGDPFVFSRGREEVEALEDRGVPWGVVPGITSAIASPAAVGIPVSHRDYASVVTIATGHEARGKDSVPWERIAKVGGTIVVLMCSDRVREIARRLVRGGLPPATPAAVVSRASWPDQEVRRATLGTVTAVLEKGPIRRPSLLVIGKVATLGAPRRRVLPTPRPRARRRSG